MDEARQESEPSTSSGADFCAEERGERARSLKAQGPRVGREPAVCSADRAAFHPPLRLVWEVYIF